MTALKIKVGFKSRRVRQLTADKTGREYVAHSLAAVSKTTRILDSGRQQYAPDEAIFILLHFRVTGSHSGQTVLFRKLFFLIPPFQFSTLSGLVSRAPTIPPLSSLLPPSLNQRHGICTAEENVS